MKNTENMEKECAKINVPLHIITKANNGDAVAQLDLGKTYLNATFVEGNCFTAFKWVSLSAEQGNREAQVKLGDLYALGHGTLKCISEAYRWYTKAAIQGYKKALIRIHNLYQDDIKMHCRGQINSEEEICTSDIFKRFNEIRELNEYRLEKEKSILNNVIDYYTKQRKYYQSADQDDPTVQLNMAFLYQHGYGVKKCIRWALEYYEKAAEQGNIDAQYNLGNLYQKHPDMKFNYRNAFKWYTVSAQGGNMASQRSLAYFYLKGLATDIDYGIALSWYIKAAESGDSESQVILGKLYRKGDYIKQDLPMAVKWYSLAARQGNIVAQNCLSQLYQRGKLKNIELDQDLVEYFRIDSMEKRLCTKLSVDVAKLGDSPELKQVEELARCALIGDGHAMYKIGLKYFHGDMDFIQDQDTGVKWIKNAANAKHKGAQSMIAEIYKEGDSIEQDYHKAVIWYKKLAKQRGAAAQCKVGVMYKEGLGTRQDSLEASKWFIWAAEQGDSNAQLYLSRFRFYGVALHKDEKEGLDWLYKSASQRNIEACYALSALYFKGEYDLEVDIKSGLALLNFTAKNGFTPAQLDMARRFQEGDGTQQDLQKCIEYYEMASNTDNGKAEFELAMIHLQEDDYLKGYDLMKRANDKGYYLSSELFGDTKWYSQNLIKVDMFIDVTEKGIEDLHYLIGSKYERGSHTIDGGKLALGLDFTKAIKWYLLASNNGDSRADYRLGIMHEFGRGVNKNLDKAIRYYERATLKENLDSRYRLACMYLNGYGVTQDLLKAFHYYFKASNMGHEEATKALTISKDDDEYPNYYENPPSDEEKMILKRQFKVNMLEKATEEGYTQLQYQIGVWYENKKDNASAFKWFSRAADIGMTDAYYKVGVLYEEGRDVEQDYRMAAKMYHKATEKEHEDAYYRLGQLYQYGKGVKFDHLKSYQLYKKAQEMGQTEAHKVLNITLESVPASNGDSEDNVMDPLSQEYQDSLSMCKHVAEHGDTDVQFQVGFAYEHVVSEPDYMEAFNWYSMAAEDSHREAIYHLGLLHEKGLGIPQNYQKAIQLYNRAAQLNSDKALHQLGVAYHHGNGVSIDSMKAIEYYTLSASMGNPEYQYWLGRLYEKGQLVQKDPQEALKWYTKSYLQGYDGASPNLYAMYDDKPYEEYFYIKLFRNLSIASCGHFRLNDDYMYFIYSRLNIRLAIFCALGYGTKRSLRQALAYVNKKYTTDMNNSVLSLINDDFDLSVSEKLDILKGFEENETIMNQFDKYELFKLATFLYEHVAQTLQGCNNMDDQDNPEKYAAIKRDSSRAFRWMKMAAEKSYLEAMFQLGVMYCSGHGVEKDTEQGERWLVMAEGNTLYNTEEAAVLFHTSQDMQDFTLAHKWYKRLETLNEDDNDIQVSEYVQLGFGLLYEYGDGVAQDYQKAMEYYIKLVDGNRSAGMHRLALMYYYGKGVAVDYQKSFDFFKKANDGRAFGTHLPYVYNSLNGNHSRGLYCVMNTMEIYGENSYYLGLQYKYGQGIPCDQGVAQTHLIRASLYGCMSAECEVDDPGVIERIRNQVSML